MQDVGSAMPVGGEGEARGRIVAGQVKLGDRSARTDYAKDPGGTLPGIGEAHDSLPKQIDHFLS